MQTAGNETDGYDLNSNTTTVTIGGSTFHDGYDDEDRLTSVAIPGGFTDTYTYNGLGLRVGKVDSTGTYSYICDGTTPGSPVLNDGHAVYTGGISENRGGAISFRHDDNLGSVRFTTNSSQAVTANLLGDAFGEPVSASGALPTPLRFVGGNGCQTEADTGIVLMGHRYYDSRIGRFLTQDPAGDGDNWYAYAGNSPVNEIDPEGLTPMDGPGSSPMGSPGYMGGSPGGEAKQSFIDSFGYWTHGAPTGIRVSDGQPSVEGGEAVTSWVPGSENFNGPMIAGNSGPTSGDFWREFWKQVIHEGNTAGKFQDGSYGAAPAGGQREINKVPDLTGKTRAQADQILKGRGFNYKGKTPGGYDKYYHPDGGKIQIRSDGRVSRYYGSKGARVDQHGNEGALHDTGEFVK